MISSSVYYFQAHHQRLLAGNQLPRVAGQLLLGAHAHSDIHLGDHLQSYAVYMRCFTGKVKDIKKA